MTQKKAERVASLSEKVCLNGHKGDWVTRQQGRDGRQQGRAYCVSCAKESLARHKAKTAGIEGYSASPRVRVGYLPTLASKQQVEERWARSVLAGAPNQLTQLQTHLKELTDVVYEAHEVVKKSTDTELLTFALAQVQEITEIIKKFSR
jgi:hypothetical protein